MVIFESFPSKNIAYRTENTGNLAYRVENGLPSGTTHRIQISSVTAPFLAYLSRFFTVPEDSVFYTPDSNALWRLGEPQTISWDSTRFDTHSVDIELFSGASRVAILATKETNDGNFSFSTLKGWTQGKAYRIKILENGFDQNFYYSPFFRLVPDTVFISPSTNAQWGLGTPQQIQWHALNFKSDSLSIDLFQSNLFVAPIISIAPNNGTFQWDKGDGLIAGNNFQIRLRGTSDTSEFFLSTLFSLDSIFPISAPDFGSIWKRGLPYSIIWDSTFFTGPLVAVALYKGKALADTISLASSNSGKKSWTVFGHLEGGVNYRIAISGFENKNEFYFSRNFTIPSDTTVRSPSADSSWASGTNRWVLWDSDYFSAGHVSINLYEKGTNILQISASTINNGSFYWLIPDTVFTSADYQIQVKDKNDNLLIGLSDVFKITSSQVFGSPLKDEVWLKGSQKVVQWYPSNFPGSTLKIELIDPGAPVYVLSASTQNSGSFPWEVTGIFGEGEKFQIKLTDLSDSTLQISSDLFTIDSLRPIKTPSGKTVWRPGTSNNIEWTPSFLEGTFVAIQLYRGGAYFSSIVTSTGNDGVQSWFIPTSYAYRSDYQILIKSTSNSNSSRLSPFFSLGVDSNVVLLPDTSTILDPNESISIKWKLTSFTGTTVEIRLYKGGGFDRTIISSTPNSGQYSWTVPSSQTPGSNYQIRIKDYFSSSIYFYSGNFSVTGDTIFTTPFKGQKIYVGAPTPVQWTASAISGTILEAGLYLADTLVTQTGTNISNDGSWMWAVDSGIPPLSGYRFGWTVSADTSQKFLSDTFTIAPAVKVFTAPQGGDTLWRWGANNIVWDPLFFSGSTVRIYLYRWGIYLSSISSTASDNGSFSWVIPTSTDTGQGYQIYIQNYSDATQFYLSDSFVIARADSNNVLVAPKKGDTLWQWGSAAINWDTTFLAASNVRLNLYRRGILNRSIVSSTNNDGNYSWTIPTLTDTGSGYQIHLQNYSDGTRFYLSDSFVISSLPSSNMFTAPKKGDTLWQWGSTPINWDTTYLSGTTVRIYLYRHGLLDRTIISSTSNDENYSWTIPTLGDTGSGYQIYIRDYYEVTEFYLSDSFVIAAQGSLSLDSVPGLEVGKTHTITWDAFGSPGPPLVDMDLFNGTRFDRAIVSNAVNDGAQPWSIPASIGYGLNFRIRARADGDSSIFAWSNYFTIYPSNPILISSPVLWDSLKPGTPNNIVWSSLAQVTHVKIELLKGSVVKALIADNLINAGSHLWTVPDSVGTGASFFIRVVSTGDSNLVDFSPAFNIPDTTNTHTMTVYPSYSGTKRRFHAKLFPAVYLANVVYSIRSSDGYNLGVAKTTNSAGEAYTDYLPEPLENNVVDTVITTIPDYNLSDTTVFGNPFP